MILFVITSSSDQIYLVDVGSGAMFGTSGLVRPIPLIDKGIVPGSSPPEEHQVLYGLTNPNSTVINPPPDPMWALQVRCGTKGWRVIYQFTMQEWFYEDYCETSTAMCHGAEKFIANNVICVKYFVAEDGSLGRWQLNGKIINKIGAVGGEVLKEFKTEKERIAALAEYCGLRLEEGAERYISGRSAAI
jgi:arylamine N-acetyltransferase